MVADCGRYFAERRREVEARLEQLVPAQPLPGCPATLNAAMRYSLLAGGKRLRPLLLLAAADTVADSCGRFVDFACALEMIHAFSLIHDDLPAMDDDDYRRGRLTNHKVFGEAMAILAGDGLLAAAFEVMAAVPAVGAEKKIGVIREIAAATGLSGMVAGQVLDMEAEGKAISAEQLRTVHAQKTGALFVAAVRCGGILAGADREQLAALTEFGRKFGLAFQISDDVLDVCGDRDKLGKPVGSDDKNAKSTYVTLYGLDTARQLAGRTLDEAQAALDGFGPQAALLTFLVEQMRNRDH
ncbi:MAG: polyprenyl synthetase family protein [Negativicutes bacterium]|nr:polyprenyl synthetase family protein [Negativicutes bacterium]